MSTVLCDAIISQTRCYSLFVFFHFSSFARIFHFLLILFSVHCTSWSDRLLARLLHTGDMPRDPKNPSRTAAPSSTTGVPIKRGPGRPPKNPPAAQVQATPLTSLPPGPRQPATFHGRSGEARKEIGNCGSRDKKRGRGRPPHKRPAPDSESEDDIPPTFSDMVKVIIQKVRETQGEINSIEENYDNYKKHSYNSTVLAMKFYAAVPQLHERVAAGASFDDDLLESVFEELFPQNGGGKKKTSGFETTTPGKISEYDDTKRLPQPAEKGSVDRDLSHAGSRSPRRSSRTH